MNFVLQLVFGLYLGLAPIYWLPGIAPEPLATFKIALFVLSVALVIIASMMENKLRLPAGLVGPLGLALTLLSSAGGLVQSESSQIFETIKDYVLVFATLWVVYMMSQLRINVERTLLFSALLISIACAVVAAAKYAGGPDFQGPARYVADHVWTSGFSSLRTGWSNGVALYVAPLVMVFAQRRGGAALVLKLIALIAISAILLSQYAVAGRAGLLAALIIIVIALNQPHRRIYLVLLGIATTMVVIANMDAVLTQMRISRDDQTQHKADDLNTISAGRLEGTMIGLEKAMESPLFGHGLRKVIIGQDEIHNVWVRLAAECGFPAPIVLAVIVLIILGAARKSATYKQSSAADRFTLNACLGALLGGLVISMLEPRMILGTFQTTIMWWVMGGLALARYDSIRKQARQSAVAATVHPDVHAISAAN